MCNLNAVDTHVLLLNNQGSKKRSFTHTKCHTLRVSGYLTCTCCISFEPYAISYVSEIIVYTSLNSVITIVFCLSVPFFIQCQFTNHRFDVQHI